MPPDFRKIAKDALVRAKLQLASEDPTHLRYAALELRFAIEALTYDRAKSLKDFIPPEEYNTWQPRRLVEVILEIDPHFGLPSTLAIGREDVPGQPAKKMRTLGTEVSLSKQNVKIFYDALGSFLHIPTLHQSVTSAGPSNETISRKCNDIIAVLEPILASPIWNINISRVMEFPCTYDGCSGKIRKRFNEEKELTTAACLDCGAEYQFMLDGDGTYQAKPKVVDAPCLNCGKNMAIWQKELRPGVFWECECGRSNVIALAVTPKD